MNADTMTWGDIYKIFNESDGAACDQIDCDGMIGKANVEARVAFLEQQWVASQGIIGILLAKLSDEEKAGARK